MTEPGSEPRPRGAKRAFLVKAVLVAALVAGGGFVVGWGFGRATRTPPDRTDTVAEPAAAPAVPEGVACGDGKCG